MALMKCDACGREVSDRAPICPHCGDLLDTERAAAWQAKAEKRVAVPNVGAVPIAVAFCGKCFALRPVTRARRGQGYVQACRGCGHWDELLPPASTRARVTLAEGFPEALRVAADESRAVHARAAAERRNLVVAVGFVGGIVVVILLAASAWKALAGEKPKPTRTARHAAARAPKAPKAPKAPAPKAESFELLSMDWWEDELGSREAAEAFRVNVWEGSDAKGRGRVIASFAPGTRLPIVRKGDGGYWVSTRTGTGWISEAQGKPVRAAERVLVARACLARASASATAEPVMKLEAGDAFDRGEAVDGWIRLADAPVEAWVAADDVQ